MGRLRADFEASQDKRKADKRLGELALRMVQQADGLLILIRTWPIERWEAVAGAMREVRTCNQGPGFSCAFRSGVQVLVI